jgi:hypothetical protein
MYWNNLEKYYLILVGVVVAIVLSAWLPWHLVRQIQLMVDSEEVSAAVVSDVECFSGGEGGSQCKADVQYSTLNDGVVTTEMIVPVGTRTGDSLAARYAKGSPTEVSSLTTTPQVGAVALVAAANVALLIGISWLIIHAWSTVASDISVLRSEED